MIQPLNKQTQVTEPDGKPALPFMQLYNELVRKVRELEARVEELEP